MPEIIIAERRKSFAENQNKRFSIVLHKLLERENCHNFPSESVLSIRNNKFKTKTGGNK
jgi:hypothetical protein